MAAPRIATVSTLQSLRLPSDEEHAQSANEETPPAAHLADLRARSGLTTEQSIYAGRAAGRLLVPALEPASEDAVAMSA